MPAIVISRKPPLTVMVPSKPPRSIVSRLMVLMFTMPPAMILNRLVLFIVAVASRQKPCFESVLQYWWLWLGYINDCCQPLCIINDYFVAKSNCSISCIEERYRRWSIFDNYLVPSKRRYRQEVFISMLLSSIANWHARTPSVAKPMYQQQYACNLHSKNTCKTHSHSASLPRTAWLLLRVSWPWHGSECKRSDNVLREHCLLWRWAV